VASAIPQDFFTRTRTAPAVMLPTTAPSRKCADPISLYIDCLSTDFCANPSESPVLTLNFHKVLPAGTIKAKSSRTDFRTAPQMSRPDSPLYSLPVRQLWCRTIHLFCFILNFCEILPAGTIKAKSSPTDFRTAPQMSRPDSPLY